jgi:putative spermidine/putrescine transport system substrate-binding protein
MSASLLKIRYLFQVLAGAVKILGPFRLLVALTLALTWPIAAQAQSASGAQNILRVLAWPGYADADLVKNFEQRTGSKVEVTVIDNDDDMWKKLSENKAIDFDVFAVNTAELQRYIRSNLVVPVDGSRIPNISRQLPRFRNLKAIPGLVHGDKTFAIPYTYSEMGLIYDRQQVKESPTSVRALWDPRYRGKVLLYSGGTHNFSLAAQVMGDASPFRIEERDWPTAVDKLIGLRRNALGFYTQPEESVERFLSGHAALMFANYGSQQLKLLKAAGADVGYAIVNEGALSWLDCWAITRGARNPALAHAWINFFLEFEPGDVLLSRQGLANTTSESPYLRPQDRLKWLEPVESEDRRSLLWSRILAGDVARKVLSP